MNDQLTILLEITARFDKAKREFEQAMLDTKRVMKETSELLAELREEGNGQR